MRDLWFMIKDNAGVVLTITAIIVLMIMAMG